MWERRGPTFCRAPLGSWWPVLNMVVSVGIVGFPGCVVVVTRCGLGEEAAATKTRTPIRRMDLWLADYRSRPRGAWYRSWVWDVRTPGCVSRAYPYGVATRP